MKKVTSALLALTLLLPLAAGALADGDAEPAAGMDTLAAAVEAAEPGDIVELAGGVYEPEGGVFTLTKPVSLAAAAGAQVEFRGAVVYDLAGTSAAGEVTLSGIKFTAVEGQECAAALVSGRGRVLNISGCTSPAGAMARPCTPTAAAARLGYRAPCSTRSAPSPSPT